MKGAALFAVGAASATCMVGSVALPQRDSSPLQARSTPLKMPIYQHNRRNLNDPEQTKQFAAAQHDYVRAKWGNHKVKREARESMAKRQIIGLSDVGGDSFYVGQIKIGTPAQDFNVILDTGSSDFWLADSGCSTAGCAALNLFDPTDSTSYQSSSTPFEVTYGSGAAEGTLASDTVSLAGYTVNSLTFAVCDQLAQGTLNAPASGIMGLGFQQLAASGATPFWQVLAEGSTFQKKVFTFQLARSGGSSTTSSIAPGGIFTLGQLDSSQYTGSVKYVDLSGSEGYWTIPLDAYSINSASTTLSSENIAAIDTGTSLIIAPPEVADAIYQQIPGSQIYSQSSDGSSSTYAIPCTSNVQMTMTFGGTTYSINSADMLNGIVDTSGQYCLGGILGESLGSNAPAYIVGDTFLKNVFTVFQYSPAAVGFASLVGGSAQTAATSVAGGSSQQATTSAAASSPAASSRSVIIPTEASAFSTATRAQTATSQGPVAGSGLSAPVAVTSVAVSSPSITPAGESTSASARNFNSVPLIAVFSAIVVGFFAVL